MQNKPLPLILETAKGQIITAMNECIAQTGLPAYLLEGIVLEILSDIRRQKNCELAAEINAALASEEEHPTEKESGEET